jgi:hypothetical protein
VLSTRRGDLFRVFQKIAELELEGKTRREFEQELYIGRSSTMKSFRFKDSQAEDQHVG